MEKHITLNQKQGKKQWWNRDEDGLFYFQYDGSLQEGLQIIGGYTYYVENNYIYLGKAEVDGDVYIFQDYNGGVVSGIYYNSNYMRYSTMTGYHPRGWINYNNSYYIFNDGTACRDLQNKENQDYIFGEDGTLQRYATWVAQWCSLFTYDGAYEGLQYTNSAYILGIAETVYRSIFYYKKMVLCQVELVKLKLMINELG